MKKTVAGCRRCGIRGTCKQTVFGDGNVAAPLMLVGEAPGEKEDATGLPFVGPAGDMLRRCMREAGLGPEPVFVANVLKCRPPENRTPHMDEIRNCAPYLLKQINYVNPLLVVALGGVAAKAILNTNKGVGQLRKTFWPGWGKTVLVTWHPSYILRMGSDSAVQKAELVADLRAAKTFVEQRLVKKPPVAAEDEP